MDQPFNDQNSEFQLLPIRLELVKESDQSLYARAYVDVIRKIRIEMPENLPEELPEDMALEMPLEAPINIEGYLRDILDHALRSALEDLLHLSVNGDEAEISNEELLPEDLLEEDE